MDKSAPIPAFCSSDEEEEAKAEKVKFSIEMSFGFLEVIFGERGLEN